MLAPKVIQNLNYVTELRLTNAGDLEHSIEVSVEFCWRWNILTRLASKELVDLMKSTSSLYNILPSVTLNDMLVKLSLLSYTYINYIEQRKSSN